MSDHMREQFEDTFSSQGEWPQAIEKDARGGYKFATAATAWETWQPAWEAGQEVMENRIKELEAINLGLTKTLVEMEEEKAKLVEALEAFMDIVHDSGGVAGYHLNGAVAEWDEFQDVHDAAAALAAHRKKGSE